MGLEDGPDSMESSSEAGASGAEKSREQSDRSSEQAKKATKKLMQMRGDQRKAQKSDDALFRILQEFINEPHYESLLDPIVGVLGANVSSHLIIGIISLVYTPAEVYILEEERGRNADSLRTAFERSQYSGRTLSAFRDDSLDPEIRKRITDWIDDIGSVLSYNPSLVMTRALSRILTHPTERQVVHDCIREVFLFFLRDVSLSLDEGQADTYAEFIVGRIEKKADTVFQKGLQLDNSDENFLTDSVDMDTDARDILFG